MKTELFKKITSGILLTSIIFSLVLPISELFSPKKAMAQLAVADAGSIIQSILITANTYSSAASNYSTAYSTYSMQLKEFVLDGLAVAVAKIAIRKLTTSVVTWINSGFEGSPSFLTNPGDFFLDVADQVTGAFLAKVGGPLTGLCSPFSIDIRLALAFKYHPNVEKRYTCTLGAIIKNSANAIEGASMNGFTAGDFRQGGWPAFVSLTTQPQNNIFGAYLEADSELSIRVANAQLQKKDELSQGRGFLSWQDCKIDGSEDGYYADLEAKKYPKDSEDRYYADLEVKKHTKCTTQTPGSVIQESLIDNINGPLHELQLADELNEIVNALFASLVTQILTKGLGAVTGSGASDSTSYINQIKKESADAEAATVKGGQAQLAKDIDTYIANTPQYRNNKAASLKLMTDLKIVYDNAKACYLARERTDTNQARIDEVDGVLDGQINPSIARLTSELAEADRRLADPTLNNLKNKLALAKTTEDISAVNVELNKMLQNGNLTTTTDLQNSRQELDSMRVTSKMQSKAEVIRTGCGG